MNCPYCEGYDYIKNGTYQTNYSYIQKYYCKDCGRWYIENEVKGEKKPELNQKVIELYEEGMPQRKIAETLGISKRTVYKKIKKYKKEEED